MGDAFYSPVRSAQPPRHGSTWAAGYRADGLRAWKSVSGVKTYFLYDEATGDPAEEYKASGGIVVRKPHGWRMRPMTDSDWKRLEERARRDADDGRYFAVRRLFALPEKEPLLVGIVGPYDIDDVDAAFYVDSQRPGKRLFSLSVGDRLQAISFAVETCRLHLVLLLKDYPEGLVDETGELYPNSDLPSEPAIPPPLDYDRLLAIRRTVRAQRPATEDAKRDAE